MRRLHSCPRWVSDHLTLIYILLSRTIVNQPNLSRPVFVHALEDCPPAYLPEYAVFFLLLIAPTNGHISGTTLNMKKDGISLTHYLVVEHFVARGEAELV